MMKLLQIGFSALAAALALSAPAQTVMVPRHPSRQSQSAAVNRQGLMDVQQDLLAAIKDLEMALPIYNGDRIRSIKLAHRALVMVDHSLYGAKAPVRPASTAKDGVSAKTARSKYTAAQLESSQAHVSEGYQMLVTAGRDLTAAVNNNPGKKGLETYNLISQSAASAKTSLAIHAGA